MAINTAAISSALPCADRNRTRPNTPPPMAMPTPMLPCTNATMVATTKGSIAVTIKNRLLARTRNDIKNA